MKMPRRILQEDKAAAKGSFAAAYSQLPDSDNGDYPSISQISMFSSAKVIGVAKGDHGATATNDRPEATMKMPRRVLQEDNGNNSMSTTYSDELEAIGIGHLSTREKMWYKNQMYLLAKQKGEAEAAHPRSPSRVSSRYESNDRSMDHYTEGINKHRHSPKAVHDFDEFESENMYGNMKHCDSRKEVRFRGKDCRRSSQVSYQNDDDTQTNQSSCMFDEDDTCNQSSSFFGDDTRTDQSSSLFHEEDTCTDASERNCDEVTLGSITLGSTTLEDTTMEGESFLTSPDDDTATSYVFELLDDGNKQRRKYKLGVGHNPTSKSKKGMTKAATPSSNKAASTGRRDTVHVPRGRRGKNSRDDADFTDDNVTCPFLPEILEEVSGTYNDAKSALDQVLYAFFVSEDDIDRMADKLRDAKLELAEIYHQQKANESSRGSVHFA